MALPPTLTTATYTALYRPAAPLPPPGATALNAYHRHCIVAFVTVVVVIVVVVVVVVVVRVSIGTVIIFASNCWCRSLTPSLNWTLGKISNRC